MENEELEAVIELDLFEVENVAEPEIVYEFQEQFNVFNETPPASPVDQPGNVLTVVDQPDCLWNNLIKTYIRWSPNLQSWGAFT